MTRPPSVHLWATLNKSQTKVKKAYSPPQSSTPSSTQLLLERLAKPEPLEIQPQTQLPPRIPLWPRSPWSLGPDEWNYYHHSQLPARYKWWYALRQTPRLMGTVVILCLSYPIKRILNPPPPEEQRSPKRTAIGSAIYRSLATDNRVNLLGALDKIIKPWGQILRSTGISNYPTFTGDREIIYCSCKRARGRDISVGDIVAFLHPSHDTYLTKRVRALEGDVFYQQSRAGRWGKYMVEVRVYPFLWSAR